MQIGDFAGEYQAKTDEELLRLAMDSDQLTAEAQAYLTSEFAKRGISAERVRAFRERPEPVVSSPIVPGRDSYTIGPPLPSETSKAPWRPKVAGRIAFFFGPVAGALVVVVSLRRMGYPQSARKVLLLALGMAASEAVIIFFIPDALSRLVGFGAEIAFLLIFPVFMENEFSEWQAAHPSAIPSNGWRAIGWGLVGTAVLLVIFLIMFIGLSALSPAGH
jgi:hypothetical protein